MKKLFLTLLATTFLIVSGNAQDISGSWNGALNVGAAKLRLVVNISKTDNGYKSTLDSPDQGAKGIPVSKTTFENSKLSFEIPAAGILYIGDFQNDKFVGTFNRGGVNFRWNW